VIDVKSVLRLPSVRLGVPTVVAGAAHLSRKVRWLHVCDLGIVAHYLHGGELILTNGTGNGTTAEQRRNFVRSLVEVGAAGLMLELGLVYTEVPPEMVEECERADLPLIVLARHVAFVDVSYEVNSALVNQETEKLKRRSSLTSLFLERVLEGATVPQLVEELSDHVGNPVVLRDQLHGIVAVADRGVPEGELLLAQSEHSDQRRFRIPLPGPKVSDWRLIVLPLLSKLHDEDLVATEEAARAISILLSRDQRSGERERWDPQLFLLDLLETDSSPSLVSLRAAHIGFEGRFLVPFALFDADEQIEIDDWYRITEGLRAPVNKILLTSIRQGYAYGVLGVGTVGERDVEIERLESELRRLTKQVGYQGHINFVVGDTHQTWQRAAVGMRDVREALRYAARRSIDGVYDISTPDVRRLTASLAPRHDFQDFVDRILTPVIEYDRDRSTPLLPTLIAFCRNGGRKSETAKELHIERSSLYDRLSKLERVLGLSFNDAEGFLSVQLAVIAHEEAGTSS